MAQTRKRTHKRSTSVPTPMNGSSSNAPQSGSACHIAISAQFPPQLAAALASGLTVGYYQTVSSSKTPKLLKSHSGFVRKAIPSLDDHEAKSNHSTSTVTFAEQYQPVVSPQQQSMSPPLTPTGFQGLSLQNQSGSNRSSDRSSVHTRDSVPGFWRRMPSSPSVRLSSIRGGGLQLDLTDILVEEATTPRQNSSAWHTPFPLDNMPIISSPDATSPKDDLPPILTKTYSNNSLFTLYSGEDISSTEDLVASNTKKNSQIAIENVPVLSQLLSSNIESLNLKEDFMEYQNEQKDSFNNIGMGASGIVRKAFHFRSCKMVAIKQCRSKQKHQIYAFIKEAKIYRKFEDNDNIVNILGFGKDKDNGTCHMAMEYMDLGSCDTLKIVDIKQKEVIVGYIVWSVLAALRDVHSNLYVHNDIKPANILCNKYGEIKLSDFGTMLRLKHSTHKLHINNGTQRYQSPEKLISQPIAYNTATDIWSVGVTAYELLFGEEYDELAFCNNTPHLTPKQHGLSSECCDFIMKCLEKDYVKRESALQLLSHSWFTKHINTVPLKHKWPWLKNKNKKVSFVDAKPLHQFYNEDLLFMISALIIYYSMQSLDLCDAHDSTESLHRRQSHVNPSPNVKIYSDEERIENIAKYALCSTKMVVDRIKVTVAFIKAQINKLEKL